MIVSEYDALHVFLKLPIEMQSYYFHPSYVIYDAMYKKEIEPMFFVLEQGNNIFYHAFHLGKVEGTEYKDIQSPYGYGGPLYVGSQEFVEDAIQQYKEWCRKNNVLVEFIRFYPLCHNEEGYYGTISENRKTVWIDLKNDNILASFQTRVRTAVRKAQKSNIRVIFSKERKYVVRFIELYKMLMNDKKASKEYFFNEEYFWSLIDQEQVYLVNAENEQGEIIGASIFLTQGKKVEYHLSTSDAQGRKMSVSTLLIYEFAQFAKDKNYLSMYLGGGTNSSDENSLLFFKRGFSKNEGMFYIGSFQHNEAVYEKLRTDYIESHPEKESYILFYR